MILRSTNLQLRMHQPTLHESINIVKLIHCNKYLNTWLSFKMATHGKSNDALQKYY